MSKRHVDRIYSDSTGRRIRTTTTPFRQWAWYEKLAERLYRRANGGQIRTLVVSDKWHEMRGKID